VPVVMNDVRAYSVFLVRADQRDDTTVAHARITNGVVTQMTNSTTRTMIELLRRPDLSRSPTAATPPALAVTSESDRMRSSMVISRLASAASAEPVAVIHA